MRTEPSAVHTGTNQAVMDQHEASFCFPYQFSSFDGKPSAFLAGFQQTLLPARYGVSYIIPRTSPLGMFNASYGREMKMVNHPRRLNLCKEVFSSALKNKEELEGKPLQQEAPRTEKGESYLERRRRNNASAKKSRDARNVRELQTKIKAEFLEEENFRIREELMAAREENIRLRRVLSGQV